MPSPEARSCPMKRSPLLILPLFALLVACEAEDADTDNMEEAQTTVEHVGARSPADGDNVLPFSGAVWAGNTLYISGMLRAGGRPGSGNRRAGGDQRPGRREGHPRKRGADDGRSRQRAGVRFPTWGTTTPSTAYTGPTSRPSTRRGRSWGRGRFCSGPVSRWWGSRCGAREPRTTALTIQKCNAVHDIL